MPDIPDDVWDQIEKDLEMTDVENPQPEPVPEPDETDEPAPQQTDNRPRDEDGEQDVTQDPVPHEGSV